MKKLLIISAFFMMALQVKAQFQDTYKITLKNIKRFRDAEIYGDFAVAFYQIRPNGTEKPFVASNGRMITCLWGKSDANQPDQLGKTVTILGNFTEKVVARFFVRIREHDNEDKDDTFTLLDHQGYPYGFNYLAKNDALPDSKDKPCCGGCTEHQSMDFQLDATVFNGETKYLNVSEETDHILGVALNNNGGATFEVTMSRIPGQQKVGNNDDVFAADDAIKAKNLTADCRFTGGKPIVRVLSSVTKKPAWEKDYDNYGWIGYFPETGRTLFSKTDICKYWIYLVKQGKGIGWPKFDYSPTVGKPGGARQEFEGGILIWSPTTQTHLVKGLVRVKWEKIGADYTTGFPKTDEISLDNNSAVKQDFENGTFYYKYGESEAYFLKDYINNKYNELNGRNGVLGFPISDMTVDAPKNGAIQWFGKGTIYFSSKSGAHYIPSGTLYQVYSYNGFHTGKLGYPIADPITLDGVLSQEFEGGLINGKNVILNTAPEYNKFKKLIGSSLKKVNFN